MHKICVISIYVSNMELAKQFYCEKLGFEVAQDFDDTLVELVHDGIPVILCQVALSAQSNYPNQSQVVLGLQTDNLVQSITEMTEKGIEVIYDTPQPCPPGYYSAFKDPFGNVIELLQFN
ncbi:VOC family protein [Paenibacillus glacialis]|uniref:Glyoxalase n=1 Tax=Paenibacillus glacialis TaxID=494026 RepID=A0A168K6M1_9BACL|nr:VOC family protein [Paenibacillus glacialis]OAB41619.1 glyoxalase [Paenibacillus glacialis]